VTSEKIEKRRSNLLKLNEENEKLQLELKAMSDRLKAAEEKRARLQAQGEEGTEDRR
jgi:outer membrane murein-binding lipoprotein Lpp